MKTTWMGMVFATVTTGAATGAVAQTSSEPQIMVSAVGSAKTPPDRVAVGYNVRGEGATSDEATTKLRDTAKAIRAGAEGMLRGAMELHSSEFSVTPVRSRECGNGAYGAPQLSTGPCAIQGYVATLPVEIETPRVAEAGTLVGLIGRLGGLQATVRRFWVSDDSAARQQAMRNALNNAREEARLIAEGSGHKLGALLRVQDSNYRDMTPETRVSYRVAPPPAPAAPPPPPPIEVGLSPAPISTTVSLMAAYAIDQ